MEGWCWCLIYFPLFVQTWTSAHGIMHSKIVLRLPVSINPVWKLPHRPFQSGFLHSTFYILSSCQSVLTIAVGFRGNWMVRMWVSKRSIGVDEYLNNPCQRLWRWRAHSGEDFLGSRVQGKRPWHPHLVPHPFCLVYVKDTFMFTLSNTLLFHSPSLSNKTSIYKWTVQDCVCRD